MTRTRKGFPFLLVLSSLILLFLLPISFSQQQGPTRYVNNTDPTCQGKSPCHTTIQAAVNAALPGDTIQIQAGTYAEKVTISGKNNTATATEADRIIIEADPLSPLGSVVVTGASSVCTNGYAFQLQQSKFITIRALIISGAGGQAISLLGGINQNQAIHIEQNRIFDNGSSECNGGITIARGNPDTLIVNNLIYANGRNGITFIDADGGPHYIVENTIHANQWSGVRVARSHEVFLVNNSITQNGAAAGSTGGRFGVSREASTAPDPQGIHLLNNLICGNRLGEIDGPALDTTDSGNLTPQGTEGAGVSASPGCEIPANVYANVNGLDGIPNTADDDFRLVLHSPAIDKGMDPRSLGLNVLFNALFEADFLTEAIRPSDGNADRVVVFDIGAFEFPNAPPIANAGPDQSVFTGTLVTLNGTQSSDPEGATLTYQWTIVSQPAGSSVALNDPVSVAPRFTPAVAGDYLIQLVVNDGQFDSAPDTVLITARLNRPPTANAGGPYTGTVGVPIQFSGSGSDPDGDPVTFSWSFGDGSTPLTTGGATPTHGYATPGIFTVTLTVTDAFGAIGTSQTTATVNQALVLNPIGDKTVNVGSTLSFTVTATSTDPVTLSVSPLPLPANAAFNALTGLFTFKPALNQIGFFLLTFTATSGAQSASETITITVPEPPPQGVTALTGRLLDANAFQLAQTVPVVGAVVSILGTGRSAESDASGNFTITGIPSGSLIFDINGSSASLAPDGSFYAGFREDIHLIAGVNNVIDRPFFLPRIAANSLATVNPNFFTTVTNPDMGITLTVPPGTAKDANGNNFTGQLSISEVPKNLAPAALPDFLDPGLLITIQPVGVTFSTPVPITFPNIDNLPAGSQVDIWSLNAEQGVFEVVGTGLVSADGTKIQTISGGVRAADWHFTLPPQLLQALKKILGAIGPILRAPFASRCNCTSSVEVKDGSLEVDFSLSSYRSLGASRSLRFAYNTQWANPKPMIPFEPTIPVRSAVPPTLSYKLSVAGVAQGTETFVNTSGLNENLDESARMAVSFDASGFTTGLYPFTIRATSNFLSSRVSSDINDEVLIRNERKSPFGAGWALSGVERVFANFDGSLSVLSQEGSLILFTPDSPISSNFFPVAGDFSSIVKNPDGAFTRTLKDGTKINFNTQGLETSLVDRNGNTTSYTYDAQGRLISITDPAGLTTTFAYSGGLLGSLTDPSGRQTIFTHDAQGNLTKVTFPDGSFKSFGYDTSHLMTSEADERGFISQRQYDSLGRFVSGTRRDGTSAAATNIQDVGFVDPASGVGTQANPAPVARPNQAVSTITDGKANKTSFVTDSFGATTRQTDALGQTTLIDRDDNGLPTKITRPNGAVLTMAYDSKGNLLTSKDPVDGTTTFAYEPNFNLVTSIKDPNGKSTAISYDLKGNPIEIIDALGEPRWPTTPRDFWPW